jgi:hypothetical protein
MWYPDDFQHLQALGVLLDRWFRRWVRRSLVLAEAADDAHPSTC